MRLWANADVTVAGQDITGLMLELQRGATISGQVAIQATSTPPPADLSRVRSRLSVVAGRDDDDDGRRQFAGRKWTPPGASRSPTCSRAATASGRRFPESGACRAGSSEHHRRRRGRAGLAAGRQGHRSITGMAVTLTDRITELSGTVVDEKGKPATEQTMVLYPADQKYWTPQSRRIRTTRAGEDGRYYFRVVPPGEYRLATLVDPEPATWYDKRCSAIWNRQPSGSRWPRGRRRSRTSGSGE